MPDFLKAFEFCAKAVRSVVGGLVDCDVRGAEWLTEQEADEEVWPGRGCGNDVGDGAEQSSGATRHGPPRDQDAHPWWSVEAVKARARVESPLSATFNDEPVRAPRIVERLGPDERDSDWLDIHNRTWRFSPLGDVWVCTWPEDSYEMPFSEGIMRQYPGGYGEPFVDAIQSPAVSATDSAVEDLPDGCPPRPSGTDSQIVELTSNAEERVAHWVRASVRHGKSDADLVRGVQRLIAVSEKK
jgi:hypothetical protein